MANSAVIRNVFFLVWTLATSTVVYLLYCDYREPSLRQGVAVAEIATLKGSVQFRPDAAISWNDAIKRQSLFEGDAVLTGPQAHTKITFKGGRSLEIGENSQITITAGHDQGSFEVSLLKGSLEARNDGKSSASKIIINTGKKTFALSSPKDHVNLVKPVGKAPVVVALTEKGKEFVARPVEPVPTPIPVKLKNALSLDFLKVLQGPSLSLAAFKTEPSPTPTPSPLPKPVKPRPPKPLLVVADGMYPKITTPDDGVIVWTDGGLGEASEQVLSLGIELPPSKPTGWHPLVEVRAVGLAEKPALRSLAPLNDDGSYGLLLDALKEASGLGSLTIQLKPAAQLIQGGEKSPVRYSTQAVNVKIRTLKDLAAGPVGLRLSNFHPVQSDEPLFSLQTPEFDSDGAMTISLASSADTAKLLPLIRGAKRFAFTEEPKLFSGEGIFVARGNHLIASIKARDLTKAMLKSLRQFLGADIIFEGSADAFLAAKTEDHAAREARLANAAKGGTLFVVRGGQLIAINGSFIASNQAVASFVERNAAALFVKPIEVLDTRY